MLSIQLLLALAPLCCYAIPIDNGVEGEPEIECGPRSIAVNFNTQNNFEGHVYVKGLFDREADGCRKSGDGSRRVGDLELTFDQCNVQRERSLNPKGVFVRTTVVINFHPRFLTKIDRAYTIQCFYMEADKTVSTEIEVSMITTGFETQFVPMPVCRYEILESDRPDAQQVQFALIGQAVYHKWTCDTETTNTFCMVVYSCFVDDGSGDRLDLLGEDGCATDRYLVGNLDYPTDLMAGKEVHVFKYADRPQLFFQCQIRITVKEPEGECERPQCDEPLGAGDGQPNVRRRRDAQYAPIGVVDVSAHVETLDIDDQVNSLPREVQLRRYASGVTPFTHDIVHEDSDVCMSATMFSGLLVGAVALAAMIFVGVALASKRL